MGVSFWNFWSHWCFRFKPSRGPWPQKFSESIRRRIGCWNRNRRLNLCHCLDGPWAPGWWLFEMAEVRGVVPFWCAYWLEKTPKDLLFFSWVFWCFRTMMISKWSSQLTQVRRNPSQQISGQQFGRNGSAKYLQLTGQSTRSLRDEASRYCVLPILLVVSRHLSMILGTLVWLVGCGDCKSSNHMFWCFPFFACTCWSNYICFGDRQGTLASVLSGQFITQKVSQPDQGNQLRPQLGWLDSLSSRCHTAMSTGVAQQPLWPTSSRAPSEKIVLESACDIWVPQYQPCQNDRMFRPMSSTVWHRRQRYMLFLFENQMVQSDFKFEVLKGQAKRVFVIYHSLQYNMNRFQDSLFLENECMSIMSQLVRW